MTENDKHLDKPEEEIKQLATKAWEIVCANLNIQNPSEKATLEKCEVVEL